MWITTYCCKKSILWLKSLPLKSSETEKYHFSAILQHLHISWMWWSAVHITHWHFQVGQLPCSVTICLTLNSPQQRATCVNTIQLTKDLRVLMQNDQYWFPVIIPDGKWKYAFFSAGHPRAGTWPGIHCMVFEVWSCNFIALHNITWTSGQSMTTFCNLLHFFVIWIAIG